MGEEIPLNIPVQLKAVLEEDCYRVLRKGKLCQLPAQPNVESVLREYYLTVMDSATEETNLPLLSEVLDGIKVYFDFMLADQLLYSVEKDQFRSLGVVNPVFSNKKTSQLLPQDMSLGRLPSQVYGPTHLLRLFVRLPHLLMNAQLPTTHITTLHVHFKDFLGFLLSRQQEFFREDQYSNESLIDLHLPQTNSVQ